MGSTAIDNSEQQIPELSLAQLNAIDSLVQGNNDRETAALVGVTRVTVTRWRLDDPVFKAELNQRRAEVWNGAIDRLRSLIPKAIEVLVAMLEDKQKHGDMKAAFGILRLLQSRAMLPAGPTDPQHIPDRTEKPPVQ